MQVHPKGLHSMALQPAFQTILCGLKRQPTNIQASGICHPRKKVNCVFLVKSFFFFIICCCFVFACVSTSLGACLLLHLVSTVSTFTSCFMKHCVSYFMVSEPNMQASAQPKVPNQKCCQKYPQSVL